MQSVTNSSIHFLAPISFAPAVAKQERFRLLRFGREIFSPFFSRQYHVQSKNAKAELLATSMVDPRSFIEESLKVAIWCGTFFSMAYLVRSACTKSSLPMIRAFGEKDLSFTAWMDNSAATKYLHLSSVLVASSAIAAKVHALYNPIQLFKESKEHWISKPLSPEKKAALDEEFEKPSNASRLQKLASFIVRSKAIRDTKVAKNAKLLNPAALPSGGEVFLSGKKAHHNAWVSSKVIDRNGQQLIQLKDLQNRIYASANLTAAPEDNELRLSNLIVNDQHPEIRADYVAGDGFDLTKEVAKKVLYSALRKGIQKGFGATQNHKNPVVRFLGKSGTFMAGELLREVETNPDANRQSLTETALEATLELTSHSVHRLAGKLFDRIAR